LLVSDLKILSQVLLYSNFDKIYMKTVPMNESLNDSERAALYGKFKVGKD
jgi:hypothetical protein